VNSVNTFLSGISALSAGGVSTHGLQSVINALSNRISAAGGGSGSVTSTELSAVSAQAASAISTLTSAHNNLSTTVSQLANQISNEISVRSAQNSVVSQAISVLSQQVSALSQVVSVMSTTLSNEASVRSAADAALSDRIDAIPGGGSANVVAAAANDQVISATALTDISGLAVSVSAGVFYKLEAGIMITRGTTSAPIKFGLSGPAFTRARGGVRYKASAMPGIPSGQGIAAEGGFGDTPNGSVLLSIVVSSVGTLGGFAEYVGVLDVSTTGVIRLMAAASAGTAATTVHGGSYVRVWRLN
jgi:hypothetical protein